MNNDCRRVWSGEDLATHFPKAWLRGKYQKHREDVLLREEMARMPHSHQLVENYKESEKLKEEIDLENNESEMLKRRLRDIEISRWNKQARIDRIKRSGYYSDGLATGAYDTQVSSPFIKKCPVQTCRGYLSSDSICCVCDARVCTDCLCVIEEGDVEDHVCDNDVLATAHAIRRDSKPCPQCGMAITRISGCSQMWCTQCHAAFDWKTGGSISPAIAFHNPHHTHWLRQANGGTMPRQPGDVPCGGELGVTLGELTSALQQRGASNEDKMRITDQYMHVSDLFRNIIPKLARPGFQSDNSDLRLKFMLKHIDEAKFKACLAKREHKRKKQLAVRECYEAKVNAVVDVLHRFTATPSMTVEETCAELREIRFFMGLDMDRLAKKFDARIVTGPTI
jgi:hypothetical protein